MTENDPIEGQEVQYDLLFTAASSFGEYVSSKDLACEALRPIAEAFRDNVERIWLMSQVPQSTIATCVQHATIISQATFDVLGKPVMDDTDLSEHGQEIWNRHLELMESTYFEDRPLTLKVLLSDSTRHHKHVNVNEGVMRRGFLAMLGAQVIGAWTAFDALTTDVWIAIVNERPNIALNAPGLKDKSFNLSRLQQHDFNWHGRIGDLLKDKVDLTSYKGIKTAFKQILPNADRIHEMFDSPRIAATLSVRNNLVHKAGRADNDFIDEMKSTPPWSEVRLGQYLPLDGPNASELAGAVISGGTHLLLSVDAWLRQPATPSATPPSPAQ